MPSSSPVILTPYDSDWPRRFEQEQALLSQIFRGSGATIEHIGSTAVPGLGAKPIIDIMLGVSVLSEVTARIPELEGEGYEYVPKYEAQLPERRYFRKPRSGTRTYHLHCVVRDSPFWRQHLLFRDYLRTHPEAAAAYWTLKQALASRQRSDRLGYTEGKTEFVESILEKAATSGEDVN